MVSVTAVVNMQRSREDIHKEIVAKYLQNSSASTKAIVNAVKTTMWTVRRTIKRLNEEGTVKEKAKSRRPRGIYNKNIEKIILRLLHRDPTQSIRDIAKKASTTHAMVQRVKKFNSLIIQFSTSPQSSFLLFSCSLRFFCFLCVFKLLNFFILCTIVCVVLAFFANSRIG